MPRKRMRRGDTLLLDGLVQQYGPQVVKQAIDSLPAKRRRPGRPKDEHGVMRDVGRWLSLEMTRRWGANGSAIRTAKLAASIRKRTDGKPSQGSPRNRTAPEG